jgi:AraC family transcriptional regulator
MIYPYIIIGMNVEPTIIEEKRLTLLGSVFYGDPFHSAEEWTVENEIGKTWQRLSELLEKYSILLEEINTNPNVAYEVHIEPEEYEKTRKYYVFVGIEIDEFKEIPLEMFIKVLPKTRYVMFTMKVKELDNAMYIFREWMPSSGYEQSYPFIINSYDERFKGLDNEQSEYDLYIPIREKIK